MSPTHFIPGLVAAGVPLDQTRVPGRVRGGNGRTHFRPGSCGFHARCLHEEVNRLGVDLDVPAL